MKTWTTPSGYMITRVLFGRCNVFHLTNRKHAILIDTGMKGEGKKLLNRLSKLPKVDYVLMTHTHFDHAGNAGLLKKTFSPDFIVHESEKEFLKSGTSPIPKGNAGWTRFIYALGPEHVSHWFQVEGVDATIVFRERFDLNELGFNGYILHTPGHSAGSSSLIIDDRVAFTGDAMGGLPGAVFPPWGDDPEGIVDSWGRLLKTNVTEFHPAHGFIIQRPTLEREFLKRGK